MQQLTPGTKIYMFLTVVVLLVVSVIAGLEFPFWKGVFYASLGAGAMGLLIEMVRYLVKSRA